MAPTSPRTIHNARVDAAINAAFVGLDGRASAQEVADIDSRFGSTASTYGEVTLDGGRVILQALIHPPFCTSAPCDGACFVDLGSGEGKMVALAAMCAGVFFSRSIGVEYSQTRHASATLACQRLHTMVDPRERLGSSIELVCGDMLQAHDATHAATHVYLSSLLFSRETMLLLAQMLDAAPKLLAIASLQEFPLESSWSFALARGRRTVRARMTWHEADSDQGSEVFMYRRTRDLHTNRNPMVRLLWTYQVSPSPVGHASVRIWIRCV